MKTLIKILLLVVIGIMMSGCFAEKTYMGKVDVVGIGAGPKATNTLNRSKLKNITLTYADKIKIKEQNVGSTTKYVVGESLSREYSGEPKFLVNYLNAYQSFNNRVLILDKNGVVAWSGRITNRNVDNGQGAYDYGLTGIDRMSFKEAMTKFVLDGDEAEDYDADKNFDFADKGSMFSNSKKYPLLFTKLPQMNLTTADGQSLSLASLINNNKPTVLVFYMSQTQNSLDRDIGKAVNVVKMFSGSDSSSQSASPKDVLEGIQEIYFSK